MKQLFFGCMMFMLLSGCSQGPFGMSWDSTSGASSADIAGGTSILNNPNQAAALALIQTNCTSCHTATSGPVNVYAVTDVNHLLSSGLVTAGTPSSSPLFQAISSGAMPPAGALTAAQQAVIYDWISGQGASTTGGSGGTAPPTTTTTLPPEMITATFASINANVIKPKCVGCHSAANASGGYAFDTFAGVAKAVVVGKPQSSKLFSTTNGGIMPPQPNTILTSAEEQAISAWITAGAANN